MKARQSLQDHSLGLDLEITRGGGSQRDFRQRPVPFPDRGRQVPDRLRRAPAAHDVCGQGALRYQGGADAVAVEQGDFKGKAKAFCRMYQFLASVLPYTNAGWEKLSIFLDFLIPKLPAPVEEDLSKGILESIDMESYRAEKQETMKLALPDEDSEIAPIPTSGGGRKPEPELDALSNIIKAFNDRFGNIDWEDEDRIRKVITEDIPARVAADQAYQNAMKNSSKSAARLEHDRALEKVVIEMLSDHTELFKQFSDNPDFKKWLADTIFGVTYAEAF